MPDANSPVTVADRPNILWICTDQQRFDTLGCYGNPFVRTPNVDALAKRGVLLERAYCQSPVCTPSRGSFLTGRYPRTARSRQNGADIPADEVLVTKLLRDAGYSCGLSGKLHLSACQPTVCPDVERRIDDGYGEFHWSHDRGDSHPSNEWILWLADKGVRLESREVPECKWISHGMPAELSHTMWCAEKAMTFIRHHAALPAERRRPWLFSVNIFDPHFSFQAPQTHLQRYLDRLRDIPLPNFVPGELDNKPWFQQNEHDRKESWFTWRFKNMTDRDHRMLRASYWAMCDLIDDAVGRLLATLDATGQRDNTIVIFMSDHGEMLGDHGFYLKGPFFYEPAVRVPMIVHWPGKIEGGRRIESLVELMDIAPTLLDAAGIERHPGMQSRSILPLLTGQSTQPVHDDVYCEYLNAMPGLGQPAHCTMLRTTQHKIVANHGREPGELYDLEADPNETRNLWADPTASAVKMSLLQRLCDRIAFTMDPLPLRKGIY